MCKKNLLKSMSEHIVYLNISGGEIHLSLNKEARKAIDNAIDGATRVGATIEVEAETNEGHKLIIRLK